MINSVMNRLQDFTFFSQLMANANMGWWKANLSTANYECSDFIVELLGLDQTGIISFEDFNKRIQKEEQLSTTVHSYGVYQRPEVVYLLDTVKGPVWVRSKVCFQETDENGNEIIYGISEVQDGPDMASAYQALQYSERLLSNIFKYLPIGIELYDMDGVLVDLNDKELEMFHIEKKEDVLGINIFDNPIFPKEMKERLKKNEDADFTFRYDFSKVGSYYQNTQKQGTIDLVTKVTTLYDSEHQPINYLLINADKTETTVAYNKIQEFEEFFELVGDYARVGYAHFNVLSGHGYAQKSWYRNVGEADETPLSDIFGTYQHFHPDDRALLIRFLDDARKGFTTKLSKEMRVLREDGTYTWTHVNLLVKKYAPQDRIIEITIDHILAVFFLLDHRLQLVPLVTEALHQRVQRGIEILVVLLRIQNLLRINDQIVNFLANRQIRPVPVDNIAALVGNRAALIVLMAQDYLIVRLALTFYQIIKHQHQCKQSQHNYQDGNCQLFLHIFPKGLSAVSVLGCPHTVLHTRFPSCHIKESDPYLHIPCRALRSPLYIHDPDPHTCQSGSEVHHSRTSGSPVSAPDPQCG